MRNSRALMWLAFCILGVMGPVQAIEKDFPLATPDGFTISDSMPGILLGEFLNVYRDEESSIDMNEAYALYRKGEFRPSHTTIPRYGVSKATMWASIIINNDSDVTKTIVLEQRSPTYSMTLFRMNESGTFDAVKLGNKETGAPDPLHYYLPAFQVELTPGKHQLFFRLSNIQPTMVLFAWDLPAFRDHMISDYAITSSIFGAMLVMVIYNLFISLISKQWENLYFVGYLGGFMVHHSYLSGFGAFILGDSRNLLNSYRIYVVTLAILCSLEFTKRFLNIKESKGFNYAFWGFRIYFGIIAVFSFWDQILCTRLGLPAVILTFTFILGASLKRAFEGYTPAYYFAIAWSFQALCVFTDIFTAMTVLPITRWTIRLGPLSLLLEMVLISLAVGEKIKIEREERYFVLARQNHKIQHAFKQMKKVFFPHQVQLIEKGIDLENTMPVGKGEACVICFDIIGSTQIQHEKTNEFLANVFRRCNEIMMEGYEGDRLVSNAYRIKEMGDGFLCSVGYPFKSKTGHKSMDALELAHRFYEAFQEEVRAFDYRDPIDCCIAIALESISGFFPQGGTREYDLYGRGIILATRYENMRKDLFKGGCPSSVIILHERVYISLVEEMRNNFTAIDLRTARLEVRDDPAARTIYHRFLNPNVKYSNAPASGKDKNSEAHTLTIAV